LDFFDWHVGLKKIIGRTNELYAGYFPLAITALPRSLVAVREKDGAVHLIARPYFEEQTAQGIWTPVGHTKGRRCAARWCSFSGQLAL
jgi:hypothetical protein